MALYEIFRNLIGDKIQLAPEITQSLRDLEQQYCGNTFKADYLVGHDSHIIVCELPGVEKKDIDAKFTGNGLFTISGTRTVSQFERSNFVFQERPEGEFSRTFPLADGYDTNNVSAVLKNGLLTVKIPRLTSKSSSITIE